MSDSLVYQRYIEGLHSQVKAERAGDEKLADEIADGLDDIWLRLTNDERSRARKYVKDKSAAGGFE